MHSFDEMKRTSFGQAAGWFLLINLLLLTQTWGGTSALSFNTSQVGVRGAGLGVFGWDFTVNSPLRVTALGLYDGMSAFDGSFPGDGLAESHAIGIWRSFSTPAFMVSVTIPSGASTELEAGFRYIPIAPIDLIPGEQYVIGAWYSGDLFDLYFNARDNLGVTGTVHPSITFGSRRSVAASTLRFPDIIEPIFGDFGPNLIFEPVPESSPATLAISVGLIVLIWKRFTRQAAPVRAE
jgi:hypothetical protein